MNCCSKKFLKLPYLIVRIFRHALEDQIIQWIHLWRVFLLMIWWHSPLRYTSMLLSECTRHFGKVCFICFVCACLHVPPCMRVCMYNNVTQASKLHLLKSSKVIATTCTFPTDLESHDWHLAMAMQFIEGDECQVGVFSTSWQCSYCCSLSGVDRASKGEEDIWWSRKSNQHFNGETSSVYLWLEQNVRFIMYSACIYLKKNIEVRVLRGISKF